MPPGKPRSAAFEELPNLDAMRALAVMLVLANHVLVLAGTFRGRDFHPLDVYLGRMGVLFFFVHTCYVLMASLDRIRLDGWALARAFYVRRAFRIYPLAMFVIVLSIVWRVPPAPWDSFRAPPAGSLAANLTLTFNLAGVKPLLGPMWTLPIEVQMYVALPAIFLLTSRVTDVPRLVAWYALAFVAAWLLPALSGRLYGATFAPCFMAGALAYAARQRMSARFPAALWLPFLGALTWAFIAFDLAFGSFVMTALQAAVCLAAGAGIVLIRESRAAPLNRAAHVIARYSYGVYLFHLVAMWLGFYRLPLASRTAAAAVSLLAMVALAIAGYHWIEAPAIGFGKRLAGRIQETA